MKRNEGPHPYINKVANDTREYVQSLLDENERLNNVIESLQRERDLALDERRSYSERYVEVEQQNTNLANLYVASYQLHGTLNREAVLTAIQEIIINLIGSEELGVWELDQVDGSLHLVASFGLEGSWERVVPGSGIIGSAARSGERFVRGTAAHDRGATPSAAEERLTAAIPLKLDAQVIGVIGIFGLLQQKPGFEPIDFELFDLLASHAASALFCTRAFARMLTAV